MPQEVSGKLSRIVDPDQGIASSRSQRGTFALVATAALLVTVLLPLGCTSEPPLLPAEIEVTLRGHQDVEVASDGSLRPLVLSGPLGICLRAPLGTDTSQWVAELLFNGAPSPSGRAAPVARFDRTVCFDADLPEGLPAGETEVCGLLEDEFDHKVFRLPCTTAQVLTDDTAYRELHADLMQLMFGQGVEHDSEALVAALDQLGERADSAGFPSLRVRLQLIAVSYLIQQGTTVSYAEAESRLDRLPAWLDNDLALEWSMVATYERARLALYRQQTEQAWQLLDQAEQLAAYTADPRRLMLTLLQGMIVTMAGAQGEAIERLRSALQSCELAPCEQRLLISARDQLAWEIMSFPDASDQEIAEAETQINVTLAKTAADEPLIRANQLINLGFLKTRLHDDHEPALAEARQLLTSTRIAGHRRRFLLAWADLVDGLASLAAGDTAAAQRRCSVLASNPELQDSPHLVACAFSCSGRAHRLAGDFTSAARAFDRAVAVHLFSSTQESGMRIPIGSSIIAEDLYRSARIAVERDRPDDAWSTLSALDGALADMAERQRCREQAHDPEHRARWAEIDAEQKELLRELVTLQSPVAPAGSERVQRSLMERLRELAREWPGCRELPARQAAAGQGLRAFALDDEIILLHRHNDGQVELVQRTPFSRTTLRQLADRVTEALAERSGDARSWRWLLQPLSQALVPHDRHLLEPVTPYALHGLLQAFPVAALPIEADEQGHERWLADLTTVVLRPAGTAGAPLLKATLSGADGLKPLFLVDPLDNLRSSKELLTMYRELFPEARFLVGEAAGSAALLDALTAASWLHFDGHGRYDPMFPELSSLALADGPLVMLSLAELPVPATFVNLSGCQTGRAPWTAGSSHLGIAGLLARRGVRWVIASRTTLEDRLALEFNRHFYHAARDGRAVPAAYSAALATVRRSYDPATWANLMLVQGGQS